MTLALSHSGVVVPAIEWVPTVLTIDDAIFGSGRPEVEEFL
jgi:hypothetical protein